MKREEKKNYMKFYEKKTDNDTYFMNVCLRGYKRLKITFYIPAFQRRKKWKKNLYSPANIDGQVKHH